MEMDTQGNRRLSDWVAQAGALNVSQAIGVVSRLIEEISNLHREGRIHRGIRADEILIDAEFRPQLGAVESVVTLGGPASDPEITPSVFGLTALTVPAEIAAAKNTFLDAGILLDPRQIDFYQLGAVLCYMLSGKNVRDYLRSCKAKSLIAEPMQKIIDRALGLNPNDCFSSAEEFAAAIKKVSDMPMNNLPFSRLAHYEILSRVGHGGMGDVYKGYEKSLDRFVAIKVLPVELSRQEDFVKRFHAEAAAIAKIDHPNVVRIYYNGEDQGYHFFAMQFVEGETLAELINRQRKLNVEQTIQIIEHCLAGVGAVHELGLIHRDVKPGNILIDRNTGRALVTDFGLVKKMQGQTQMTITGMIMGTADYIAPEQARSQEIDQRADLYALGVMMYQMLAGKLPFQADTPTAMMFQHAYEVPPPLNELSPELPEKLVRIVMKLLEKDPADRYQAAKDVLVDLHKIDLSHSTSSKAEGTTIPTFYADSTGANCFAGFTPTSRFTRIKNRIFDCFRRPKFFEALATTQQQMSGAVTEYERRHKELTRLAAETKVVLADLKRQKEQAELAVRLTGEKIESATSSENKQQALSEKQENEQTVTELAQLIAEQQEQAETIDLQLAKVTATLLQLRSQQNVLNARLNAANMNLKESDRVQGSSLAKKVYCVALLVFMVSLGGYLAYTLLSKSSLENAVIARWTFDEGEGNVAHDAAGKNHGIIHGATWTDGKFGKALSFDGIDDYVDCGNDSVFDMNGKSFTISAWIKTDDDRGGVISKHGSEDKGEWLFGVGRSAGAGKIIFGGPQFEKFSFSSSRINDGQWHHVVGVIVHHSENKNDLYEYIDGQLNCTMIGIPDINHGSLHVLLGDNNDREWALRGVVDDVCIFNRALSAKEIQYVYGNGLIHATTVKPLPLPNGEINDSDLVAYWKFDEGKGYIARDQIGKNDGTVHGAIWMNGLVGPAVSFNGVDNFIETSLKIDESGNNDYTFVTWVCPAALAVEKNHDGRQQVISTDNGEFDWSVLEAVGNWQIFTGKRFWNSGVPVDLNTWQHIAVVFKTGKDTILYKNGIAKSSGIIPSSDGSWGPVRIGNSPGGWNEAFKGMIGKTMIFKRALSAEEIRNIYLRESNGSGHGPLVNSDLLDWGLIAYWNFDEGSGETVKDVVGGNNGAIHGANWTEGKFGGALRFDGLDDFVSLAQPVIKTKEFSLAAWGKADGMGGGVDHSNPIFCQRSHRGANNQSTIYLTASTSVRPTDESFMRASGFVRSSQGSEQVLLSKLMNYGQWHFYVLAVDSNNIVFYVDGMEVGRTANNQKGDYISSIDYVFIGKHGYDAGFFNGIIDEMSIYNRALSAEKIQKLYAGK